MSNNQSVTHNERYPREGAVFISKTDLKGRITYCNRDFIEISGYQKHELLGQDHNILRHPDVPAEVYEDLWDTIQSGRPWAGVVKNRAKNGDYYWANLNVTPLYKNDQIIEYLSVCTSPTREEAEKAENFYTGLIAGNISLKPRGWSGLVAAFRGLKIRTLLAGTVFITAALLAFLACLIVFKVPAPYILVLLFFAGAATLLFGLLLTSYVTEPLSYVRSKLQQISEGNYFDWLEVGGRNDEIGELLQGIKSAQIKLGFDVVDAREQAADAIRVKTALDNVSSSVMMIDPEFNINYMNKTAENLFRSNELYIRENVPGFRTTELLGQNIDTLQVDPQRRETFLEALTERSQSELVIGTRTMRLVTNPVIDDQGRRLGVAIEWSDRTAEVAVEQEIDSIVAAARNGDLGQRISLENKVGFFRQLAEGINSLIDAVDKVFSDIAEVMSYLAKGDLTRSIEADYAGTFGKVKDDINATMANLEDIVSQMRESAEVISMASEEISSGNNNLSSRTEQQAGALQETASSMEELTNTVKNNAENAQQANQVAVSTWESAERGGEVVSNAVRAMDAINGASSEIAEIIGVIDEIAFQTNLLALNASVEAARAGEQGRGFAVVATEVRNLAGRSATAAKEIKELIEDSVDKVKAGADLVNQSGETLQEIVDGVKKVSGIISGIASASAEQSAGIDRINQVVASMDEITQQNAALAEQTSSASASLTDKARGMDELVSFFKVIKAQNRRSLAKQNVSERKQVTDMSHSVLPSVKPEVLIERPLPVPDAEADGDDEWEEF